MYDENKTTYIYYNTEYMKLRILSLEKTLSKKNIKRQSGNEMWRNKTGTIKCDTKVSRKEKQ